MSRYFRINGDFESDNKESIEIIADELLSILDISAGEVQLEYGTQYGGVIEFNTEGSYHTSILDQLEDVIDIIRERVSGDTYGGIYVYDMDEPDYSYDL